MFIELLLFGFSMNVYIFIMLSEDYNNNIENNLFKVFKQDFNLDKHFLMNKMKMFMYISSIMMMLLSAILVIRGVFF